MHEKKTAAGIFASVFLQVTLDPGPWTMDPAFDTSFVPPASTSFLLNLHSDTPSLLIRAGVAAIMRLERGKTINGAQRHDGRIAPPLQLHMDAGSNQPGAKVASDKKWTCCGGAKC